MAMVELFDRYYALQISDLLITIDDLDIEFHVEGGNKENANKTEIAIYNLSDMSKAKIKKDERIQLKAGYRNDYGIIFYGIIDRVWDERDGGDVKTVITALDETKSLFESGIIIKKYPEGTSVTTVVKDMFSAAGIPVGKVEDPGVTLPKDYVFDKTAYENIRTCIGFANGELVKQNTIPLDLLLEVGWTAYIKNNMGYFVRKQFQDVEAIILSSETGLIEVMEQESEDSAIDYKVKSLLQWKASTDSIIKLESIRVKGTFKVAEYSHVCKGEEYYSELGVKAV